MFGRRNARDSTDLQRVQMLFDEYGERIDSLKADVATLKNEVQELQKAREQERATSERRIHALRAYVSQLLDFITQLGGTPPPEPREPLD